MAPEPVQRTAVFTRLQRKVAAQEQQARQQRAVRVALVSPARSSREGMRMLLEAAGAHVVVAAPEVALVQPALAQFRVRVLIAAASVWRPALALAREAGVPLLLVAATLDEARTVAHLGDPAQPTPPVSIIIDDDLDPHELHDVLDVIARGGRWIDPALSVPTAGPEPAPGLEVLRVALRDTGLSDRDLAFLALELQDLPPEEIAQRLAIKVESVYTARSRICQKVMSAASSSCGSGSGRGLTPRIFEIAGYCEGWLERSGISIRTKHCSTSGWPAGGQPGHPRHERPTPDPEYIDTICDHFPSPCPRCQTGPPRAQPGEPPPPRARRPVTTNPRRAGIWHEPAHERAAQRPG